MKRSDRTNATLQNLGRLGQELTSNEPKQGRLPTGLQAESLVKSQKFRESITSTILASQASLSVQVSARGLYCFVEAFECFLSISGTRQVTFFPEILQFFFRFPFFSLLFIYFLIFFRYMYYQLSINFSCLTFSGAIFSSNCARDLVPTPNPTCPPFAPLFKTLLDTFFTLAPAT